MTWLHGWVGFIGGLVLVVTFTGGTLALFDTEITRWMQPELSNVAFSPMTDDALNRAGDLALSMRRNGLIVFLNLPSSRDPVLRLLHYDGHAFVGTAVNASDGADIPLRDTTGGQIFFDLHHSLYRGPSIGNFVTEAAAVGLIIAVISGVIIHFRNLLPDLILFRPFAAPGRAWMDAHIMAGVLLLPFITMMAYTGAVIHAPRLFPSVDGKHAARPGSLSRSDIERAADSHAPLAPMLHQAETVFGRGKIGFIMFDKNNVIFTKADTATFAMTRDHVDFSAQDGRLLNVQRLHSTADRLGGSMRGLHFIRWGSLGLRWLYFFCGATGSMMMSAGLILFLRRYRRTHGQTTLLKLAETLTLTIVLGLPVAALGLLWSNRLLNAGLPHRSDIEVHVFFGIWLATAIHAATRAFTYSIRTAWREQAWVIAFLGCGLPVLDALSRSSPIPGWNAYTGVNLTAFAFGALALWGQNKLTGPL
ncbi:PepSY domain-containing protein [Gluconobacter sp. Dm-62]|uniref:PepSY-associated TM helix domain-containing protein n=1 Tax=Gluconobacter sp. Dm-62 TaxID=2799804 RepID=UPI001B8AF00C|nr:PepSY-associated TM helix domain-containing protein [Gluconobacter sp. Dm-62]MBS1104332.1 PepSY domain-containing protein [Gluconobacter sp. Dm-62]